MSPCFILGFLNGEGQKCGETASNMLRLRNISARLCHIGKIVENSNYPQPGGELWKTDVENLKEVWEKAIFPAISRSFAVDNTGENCGRAVGKPGKNSA